MKFEPAIDRFYKYAMPIPFSGCWIWMGHISKKGYGKFHWYHPNGRKRAGHAHTFIYEHHHGPLPDGLEPDHKCRVRCCVNPQHLEAVTHAENVRRGRHVIGDHNRSKTHCPKGHPYDEENTQRTKLGRRCGTCHRIRNATMRARQRMEAALCL